MTKSRHRRTGSEFGSGTKASFNDLVNVALSGEVETVTQVQSTVPVRVADIPRDRVELELFGSAP